MNALRRADPVRQLVRALTRSAADAGCMATVQHREEIPWASVTFAGARHTLSATAIECVALARWLAMLPEAELPLAGHFVASCAAELEGCTARIELLVLET